MTQVATTLRSAYLAGPMRGYEEYNFPAFHKATAWLRDNGWIIESPAERDEADESISHEKDRAGWADHLGLDYFMRFDLEMVCRLDCVICLDGWENSQGARLETMVAVEVGHPVFELVKKNLPRRGFELKAVNPEYVSYVFAAAHGMGEEPELTTEAREELERNYYGCTEGSCSCGEAAIEHNLRLLDGVQPPARSVGPKVVDLPDYVETAEPSALPHDSDGRKATPLATGVLDYFPAALAEVARVSKAGNDKHNPGQPLHHARGKSTDHADALLRHLVDRGGVDVETGVRHSAEMAWRALALLQQELEDAGLAPLPRGAR